MAGPRDDGCPVCGAPIPALAGTCETCGYALGTLTEAPDATDHGATGVSEAEAERADQTGPCTSCGRELPIRATYCRYCGHAVRKWRLLPVFLMILGFCLTASIIGAVVGIPMQILALRLFREAREGTVVAD